MGFFETGFKDGNKFVAILNGQAAKTAEGVHYLDSVIERVDEAAITKLRALAAESGELRRVLIDELHRTFITPLDREDIFHLSHCYDDMVTYALTTMEEMHILGVDADEPIRRMVGLVCEEAQQLELAIQRLANNPRVAGDHAREVHERELAVERVYRNAIKELFARATDVPGLPALFYRREVYRHISNMSDRADSASNVFGMVVMKLA
ncbi:MAG: DUF47 family protein [Betaproteobacteria bacterium]|nr:DUF47 family protein [Betaproteobacteria bacterium]